MTQHTGAPPHTPAASQPAQTYAPTPDEAELIRLSNEWMHAALVDKNEARLRQIMSADYTWQVWDASRVAQGLDEWMNALFHRLKDVEFEYTSHTARVIGDMGFVYSAFRWKGSLDGHAFSDAGFMADVWSRKIGAWQVVARRSAGQQQMQQLKGLSR